MNIIIQLSAAARSIWSSLRHVLHSQSYFNLHYAQIGRRQWEWWGSMLLKHTYL